MRRAVFSGTERATVRSRFQRQSCGCGVVHGRGKGRGWRRCLRGGVRRGRRGVDFFALGARDVEQASGEFFLAEEGGADGFAVFVAGDAVEIVDGEGGALVAGEQENHVGLVEAERLGFAPVLVDVEVIDFDGAVGIGLGGETYSWRRPRSSGLGVSALRVTTMRTGRGRFLR
jgi:hypothetical protein